MDTPVRTKRRQELIDAAITTIATKGIAYASIDKIVKEAGQSKGSALYHVKDKTTLYKMVVRHVYEQAGQAIAAAVMQQPTMTAKIEAYIRENLNFIAAHPQAIVAVQKIVHEAADTFAADGAPNEAVTALQKLLELGQAQQQIKKDIDPELTAILIRQAIDAASYYIAARQTEDVSAYVNTFTTFYMNAIKI